MSAAPIGTPDTERRTTRFTYRDGPGTLRSPRGVDEGEHFVSDLTALAKPKGAATTFTLDDRGNVTERYQPGVSVPAKTSFGSFGLINERDRRGQKHH